MFGAGGGTSSYQEVEETDLIFLWGSNARETHPIFFHHVLKAVNNGARLYVVDPRRTGSAAVGRRLVRPRRRHRHRAVEHDGARDHPRRPRTTASSSSGRPPASRSTRPASRSGRSSAARARPACRPTLIREAAHAYANADRAMICWTLGITEHHNAVDNVLALINLALLTGHVGRYGSGLNPLRGQNNVQGGGDMGAIPNKLPGLPGRRARRRGAGEVRAGLGRHRSRRKHGWHLTQMFEAMERGELRDALRDRREPGAVGGRRPSTRCTCWRASTTSSSRTSS